MYGKYIENILKFDRNKDEFCFFNMKKGVVMKILPVVVALIAVFGLSGCNTFAGMGKDVQSGGRALENQAK
jgi:predicted small secreted protein